MNEEIDSKSTNSKEQDKVEQKKLPPAKKETDEKPVEDKASSGNKPFYILIVITIIAVIAVGFYANNQIVKIEKEIKQSQVDSRALENDITARVDDKLKNILSGFSGTQQKLEELESKQQVLAHSLSQPVEQQIHINEDYALTEIEHLLIIANYNLKLDHNVATALSAMEAADARLKAFTEPAALSAREQLIADMNELRSLNQADLSGMALYLSDLISRVDDLQLKENVVVETGFKTEQEGKTEEPVTGIKQFLSLVWKELRSLVIITRDNDAAAVRLLPEEVYFLRANLKLELANARFAVFNRDTENLHMSIKHIQGWLQNYFDLSDANVRNIFDALTTMKKAKLEFPELDISSSLESVRALSRIKEEHFSDEIDAGSIEQGNETTEIKIE